MKNIFSFEEYLLEKEKVDDKKVIVDKKVDKEKVVDKVVDKTTDKDKKEPVVEEKPKPSGLTPKQEKNLPQHLKDAILKAKAKRDKVQPQNEGRGIWKDKWDKGDLTLTLYYSIYGTRGLGLTEKELAEDVIGSSLNSLKKQALNFNYLRGESGLDRPHTIQTAVFDEYGKSSPVELRKICLKIIDEKAGGDGKIFQQKIKQKNMKKELDSEFRKRGFDPSKMKSIGKRPTLRSMLEDPDEITESFISGVNYDNTIVPFLKKSVGDISKLTPYILELGNRVFLTSDGRVEIYEDDKKVKVYKDVQDFINRIYRTA